MVEKVIIGQLMTVNKLSVPLLAKGKYNDILILIIYFSEGKNEYDW